MKVPGLIFLSGQTPAGPDGKLVPGDIGAHTVRSIVLPSPNLFTHDSQPRTDWLDCQVQALKNLTAVLTAAGSSWEKVVKVNIYLRDMNDFDGMNEVYEKVWQPLWYLPS